MTDTSPPSDRVDESAEPRIGILPDLLAGIALGVLVGILVGLSVAPVVASVIAALLALLGTFLGFGSSIGAGGAKLAATRMIGFGFAMVVALAGGIALRSYGALGPSFADRVRSFQVQGMEPALAHDLAIYEHTGLRTGHLAQAAEGTKPLPFSPYVFGSEDGGADPNCAGLDVRYIPDPNNRLEAMARSPEPWASYGRIGKALPPEGRAAFAEAAFQDRCKPRAAQ